jgi:hypothetical protein
MATENRRVATYLPTSLYERFELFKGERSLGESKALIAILSEYFEVGQKVAQSDSPGILARLNFLEQKISEVESRFNAFPASALAVETLASPMVTVIQTPAQMDLLPSELLVTFSGDSPPKIADGKRWLKTEDAYAVALEGGCDQATKSGFRKWSRKNPEICLQKFGLRFLEMPSGSNLAPSFEDIRFDEDSRALNT